ncbi:MAG TPA: hypothetical protein VMG59_04125 [Phycisphaerae bacterium]|nr:hypothetical protein [Phycisphaerae bacterium]
MHGHIWKMAEAVAAGAKEAGGAMIIGIGYSEQEYKFQAAGF